MKKTLCLKSGFVYQFHVSVSLLALLLKIDNTGYPLYSS